jgi:DNA-binding LacI/PurR family transcriptional regulator
VTASTRVADPDTEKAMAGRTKNARVTIRTVAEDAGVSVAAVSKVLRDAYGVSAALRAKVQASMLKLGYRPHAAARGMRGQTYTLGVLLPDLRNPFFADIMAGIDEALVRTQYQPLLGVGQSATTTEHAVIDAMIDRQMDGLLLIAPRLPSEDLVKIARSVPTSVIGIHLADASEFDTVNNDDQLGGALVVRHLHEGGYRNIAYFSLDMPPPAEGVTVNLRESGYRATMRELGLSKHIRVVVAPQTPREIQVAARHLLQSRSRPEALFCWTDFVALEVLSVARELGLAVPGDLAVVGYDNTSYCDLAQNALTSIDQSGQVLGLQSARLLIERIKGRSAAEHFVVTPRLVGRASSRAKGKASDTQTG